MTLARWVMVLAAVAADLACAGCGSSSQSAARTPVSLQELHGNSLGGVTYDIDVDTDDGLGCSGWRALCA